MRLASPWSIPLFPLICPSFAQRVDMFRTGRYYGQLSSCSTSFFITIRKRKKDNTMSHVNKPVHTRLQLNCIRYIYRVIQIDNNDGLCFMLEIYKCKKKYASWELILFCKIYGKTKKKKKDLIHLSLKKKKKYKQ